MNPRKICGISSSSPDTPKKISECQKDDIIYLKLEIPNTEIRSLYKRTILAWFDKKLKKINLSELIISIEQGECEKISNFLSDQLMDTISFFDYAENYYHGFLIGLLKCQSKYEILSDRESGTGRPDIIMKERKFRGGAVVFELKTAKKFSEMENLCDMALRQIEEQQYEQALCAEGYRPVKKYGICFYKKGCLVKCPGDAGFTCTSV